MTAAIWLRGVACRRPARMLATAIGVLVAVSLIAAIGSFLASTSARMTSRAIARVPVDWQVQATAGTAPRRLLAEVGRSASVQTARPVSFLRVPGLSTATGGSSQATSAAQIVSLPADYAARFPGELRLLAGRLSGPLLAQQTASNLHAAPGSRVDVRLPGGRRARVTVSGVVDLPAADSLFQRVGAAASAQPAAPPDNVLILPPGTFARLAGQATGGAVVSQVHVRLAHAGLPHSPSAAYDAITGSAHNLESRLAGSALVADNLGVALDTARGDALYAQLLFLFLGVPGAVLAGVLTAIFASVGRARRRAELALLRARGATTRQLVALGLAEALSAGVVGVVGGLLLARLIGSTAFGAATFGAGTLSAWLWPAGAAVAGLAIAATAIVLPTWRDARSLTVAGQRQAIDRGARAPIWARWWLDLLALAVAGLVYWQASRNGYQLVLAPEGVAQVSVNWYALLAPALGWVGLGLLIHRLTLLGFGRGRGALGAVLRPLAGELSTTVAATLSRERRLLAQAVSLVALTAAFAASTAVFNSTYQAQASVDARLTNGADVTVTESPGHVVTAAQGQAQLGSIAGVASVEPLVHRFAYIGADLQDLFAVRPATIARQGALQNAWFQGGSATGLMSRLARRPDSILVSQETVHDYQLHLGDHLRLRLPAGAGRPPSTVVFRYAGVAKEFLTAPKDSFFVANAAYVIAHTHSPAVGSFLIQTDGTSPAVVARRVRERVGTAARVTDIVDQRQIAGSNLTGVELSGLTRIELAFALVLAIGAGALTLALGFAERRRTFAIAAALGAGPRQLGAFVWSESLLVTALGAAFGAAMATVLAVVLVRVLTGVFDPPPDVLTVPWGYLTVLGAGVAIVMGAGAWLSLRALRRPPVQRLRDL